MNEQIEKANSIATALEQFITLHPVATVMILATLCSWSVTAALKPLLRELLPDNIQDSVIRLFDCVVAGAIAFVMWPREHRLVWALFIGSASPTVYFAVTSALCWQWPGLKKYLTLRELEPEPPAATNVNVPPGDTQ